MDQPREVTPRERVVAAYKGQRADRVPAYPIAGSFAGCLDGPSIEEYCTNPKKAVKAMINYDERYQPDIMIAFNDLAKEAEAVGCRVKYSDYVVPSIDQHVLQDDKGALARLEVPTRSSTSTSFRARDEGGDRGRGAALHRHRRLALALRALDLVRAAAARQPRLREVVHGSRPRVGRWERILCG